MILSRFLSIGSVPPGTSNISINVGDYYWYSSGVRLSLTSGCYLNGADCGPLCFDVGNVHTYSHAWIGSSGYPKKREDYMSSQIPTTSGVMISNIAFESDYPYSLHPTATNSSINVGDNYWYSSGVRVLRTGNCYNNGARCGPLCFSVYDVLTVSGAHIGSSGYF